VEDDRAAPAQAVAAADRVRAGARVRVRRSEFGRMLFDSRGQAIYVFERDRKRRSACYGECADAWPPVFTDGRPVAGKGARARLLGTTKRRGGRRQVTYAGKPLYFYAHEAPGEVLCHDVNLNGGFWWVIGPDGARRP
jgi:predicted lipoprotein with Yx(FWY)xxD motif